MGITRIAVRLGGIIRNLLLAIGAVYLIGQLWTTYSVLSYADPDPIPSAAAIVVLSGPWTEAHEPKGETRQRVDRGIELWNNNHASSIIMSGGGLRAINGPGDAAFMASYAMEGGVEPAAITIEPASHSTLQNAWLTARLPDVDPRLPILLVTHRYHLPRAVQSFRWAGFKDVIGVAAPPAPLKSFHFLEGLKWPLNILRAATVSGALTIGVNEETLLPLLH